MEADQPQRLKEREGDALVLDAAIEALNLAKELSSITPAKVVFGFVSAILAMIKVILLLFFLVNRMQSEMHLGCDGQPGRLRRTWASLR